MGKCQRILLLTFAVMLCFSFSSCSTPPGTVPGEAEMAIGEAEMAIGEAEMAIGEAEAVPGEAEAAPGREDTEQEVPAQTEDESMKEPCFYIKANGTTFVADFADNSSADALRDLLREGDLTVDMHDYGNFEKVGEIGQTLPQNNTQITTVPGDVILYLGTNITIYYDSNSWNFTRIGKIQNATKDVLLDVFGDGNVTVTFSLSE